MDAKANDELKTAQVTEEELVSALSQQKTLLLTEDERSKNEEVNTLVTQLAQAERYESTRHTQKFPFS